MAKPHPALPLNLSPVTQAGEGSIRILVVEDNPANALVASLFLEQMGYAHDRVENGREALEAFETGRYGLILMDLQMPEMDGYEASRRIRALERETGRMAVPIVALTAHALSGDREACLLAGMNEYLSKPFKPDELQACLERLTVAKPPVA
ncbi:response regulator [Asticcacaulis excentricus]|uniref:Response regulator receiver protein n=1 Tax=Asticcacaulis excentricus (strain ATCC 15261 / DSM 4724 / KCTC 12464 / NCIMB 9791 / VKM B-1370 / CB 48) TaxID=573065 RepID=E8RP19_ASTEC|nr:response regulator [Asticcacaulis excentricus]ADU12989.1 response regulator receiver protein [Asticcacaulis excentricus CB 48]